MGRTRDLIELITRLRGLGFTAEESAALLRIAATLHRWHEEACGDSNDYCSWAIERDDTGKPYRVTHWYFREGSAFCNRNHTTRDPIPDREKGALRRLEAILKDHPDLTYYQQRDPRGAPLFILTKQQLGDGPIEQVYHRGIAVYKP